LNPFNKKILRDIANYWHQVIAILGVLSLGIVMFTGPLHAQKDLGESINRIYAETLYEDFSIRISGAERSVLRKLKRIDGLVAVEGRLTFDSHAKVDGRKIIVRIISLPENGPPQVNRPKILKGRYPLGASTGEFMAAHQLARAFGLKLGETMEVSYSGKTRTLRISGVCVSPEYLRLLRSSSEYVTDPKSFGVVFTDYSVASGLYGKADVINDVAFRVSNVRGLRRVMERAKKILEGYGIVGMSRGRDKPQAAALDDEVSDIGKIAAFFTVLILLVSSLSIYITMTRVVRSQQREIGVIRALGYSQRSVVTHYFLYGIFLGFTGSLIGLTAGYLLSILFIKIYSDIFDLPFIRTSFSPLVAFLGILVGSLFSIAGSFFPARQAVRMKPAEAMRNGNGGLSSRTGAAKSRGAWKKSLIPTRKKPVGSRLLVLSVRNIARNWRRTFLTAVGVAATVCLMTTASGGKDSLDYAVKKYSEEILKWDVAILWEKPVDEEILGEVRKIPNVIKAEPLIDLPVSLYVEGRSLDLQLNAYKDETDLHRLHPVSGKSARPGFGEVLLNRGVGKELSIKKGDTVTVQTVVGSLPFRVRSFVSEPFGGVCYVSYSYIQFLASSFLNDHERYIQGQKNVFSERVSKDILIKETLRKILEMGKSGTGSEWFGASFNTEDIQKDTEFYNAIIIKAKAPFLPGVLRDVERVSSDGYVVTKSGMLKTFSQLVRGIKSLFYVFYLMAFAMGFSILFSMVTVTALERRREVATLRTLGAGKGKIFSFLTVETLFVVLLGLVPGIAAGRFLEWLLIDKILMSGRIAPDCVITPMTILVIVIATFVVTLVAELPAISALLRLDLARVTKERAD